MALKDWKKMKIASANNDYMFKNIKDIKKDVKTTLTIGIRDNRWRVWINSDWLIAHKELGDFYSATKALKFAKSYMRKH